MSEDRSTFEVTRERLEDIVTQVRRKDVSLEQSLDMLEEAVRLVNQCNELIDQTSFKPLAPVGETVTAQTPVAVFSIGAPDGLEVTGDVPDTGDGEAEATEAEGDPGATWGSVDAWDEDATTPVEELEDDARE